MIIQFLNNYCLYYRVISSISMKIKYQLERVCYAFDFAPNLFVSYFRLKPRLDLLDLAVDYVPFR